MYMTSPWLYDPFKKTIDANSHQNILQKLIYRLINYAFYGRMFPCCHIKLTKGLNSPWSLFCTPSLLISYKNIYHVFSPHHHFLKISKSESSNYCIESSYQKILNHPDHFYIFSAGRNLFASPELHYHTFYVN